MTCNKENLYWRTNKSWYTINARGKFELTASAPQRARDSFALFCSPKTAKKEKNID